MNYFGEKPLGSSSVCIQNPVKSIKVHAYNIESLSRSKRTIKHITRGRGRTATQHFLTNTWLHPFRKTLPHLDLFFFPLRSIGVLLVDIRMRGEVKPTWPARLELLSQARRVSIDDKFKLKEMLKWVKFKAFRNGRNFGRPMRSPRC